MSKKNPGKTLKDKYFIKRKLALTNNRFLSGELYVSSLIDGKEIAEYFFNIEQHLENSEIIKNDGLTKAGFTSFKDKLIFIKKYCDNSFNYKLRYLLRKPRGLRTLEASAILQENNILTPETYALLIVKSFGLLKSVYLLSEAVGNIASRDFYAGILEKRSKTKNFYDMLIDIITKMHNIGVVHNDCKLSNFFFSKPLPNHKYDYKIGVWDLDGARCYDVVPVNSRVRDIARIIIAIIELHVINNHKIEPELLIDYFIKEYFIITQVMLDFNKVYQRVNKLLMRKKIILNP